MTVRKVKKVNKYRAQTTHGGGSRKKRRGAGSRGGRGMAGTGKKSGHKVAGMPLQLGSKGFFAHNVKVKSVNLMIFTDKKLEKFLTKEKIKKEGDYYIINLKQIGYDKLLGSGRLNKKLKITVNSITPKAEEKILAAGGEVVKKE
jgi:large subunit ribosomal protein L15